MANCFPFLSLQRERDDFKAMTKSLLKENLKIETHFVNERRRLVKMDRDTETLLSTGQTDRDMSHPTPAGRARSSVEPPFPFACPRVHPQV